MSARAVLVITSATATILVSACERRRPPPPGRIPAEAALDRIIDARCARLELCTNLGLTAAPSPSTCTEALRASLSEMLQPCRRGVSARELDACIAGIRNEACGVPAAAISRIAACVPLELCDSDLM